MTNKFRTITVEKGDTYKNDRFVGATFLQKKDGRIWGFEFYKGPDAQWITKDRNEAETDEEAYLIDMEITAGMSAVMEVEVYDFLEKQLGSHMRRSVSGGLEGKWGHVAAWNANPLFANVMPPADFDGWYEVGFRNVNGVLRPRKIGPSRVEAQLKHDFIDMLIGDGVNFNFTFPGWKMNRKIRRDGVECIAWAEVFLNAYSMTQEDARADYLSRMGKKSVQGQIWENKKARINSDSPLPAMPTKKEGLLVPAFEGSEPINLLSVKPCWLETYFNRSPNSYSSLIRWDGTQTAIGEVLDVLPTRQLFKVGQPIEN